MADSVLWSQVRGVASSLREGVDPFAVLHGVILATIYLGTLFWATNYCRSQSSKGGDLSKKGRSSGKSRPPSRGVDLLRMSPTRRFFASLLRSGGDWSSEASVDVDGDVGRTTNGGSDHASAFSSADVRLVVPKHVAVIMDGNRRFGKTKFGDPLKGHWEGGKTLSEFIRWCMERKIDMLTVYAFSTENWSRDPIEVSTLMTIFCKYADSMKKEAMERGVRVRILSSDPDRLPAHVRSAVNDLEESTRGGTKFHLNLCVSYGGRGEIVNACKSIAEQVSSGSLSPESIDEATISRHLLTSSLPDPDLLIRTSGEFRLSNFLLYQVAYSELVFLHKTWPEVTSTDLDEILDDYARRHRRYGT